jgi:ferric enterobactin receptor
MGTDTSQKNNCEVTRLRTALLIVFVGSFVSLRAQMSSEVRITEVFRKTSLARALKVLETKYNITIAYDNALVRNIIVALQLKDATAEESIAKLVSGTPLSAEKVGGNFIIVPRPREERTQTVTRSAVGIAGTVIDADTGESLPQATLRVIGTSIHTTSNNDGYFSILSIPADTCRIEVRYLGYLTRMISADEIAGEANATISLRSDSKILNEVVVLDEYNSALRVEDQPGSVVFNLASLSSLPSLGEQDVTRTLQLLPGISATDESSSGMIIRGSHPSYNLTLLDGMTIYQQDHFFGAFSIINSDVIKDIHLHKGVFDAKYGGRVSGVADITTRNGNSTKPAFNIKVTPINVKATAEFPLGKKWSLFTAARRSFTDVAETELFKNLFGIARTANDQVQLFRFDDFGLSSRPKYYFFDANSKLTFRPSSRDNVSLSLYLSRDQMRIKGDVSFDDGTDRFIISNDERTRWGNNGVSLRWSRQWDKTFYSSVRISNSRFFRSFDYKQYFQLNDVNSLYGLGFNNYISDLSYAADNELQITDHFRLEFGAGGTKQETRIRFKDEYSSTGIPPETDQDYSDVFQSQDSWVHSLYGSSVFTIGKRLNITPGIRLSVYDNGDEKFYPEPRLKAEVKVLEWLNLKGGYARSNQFITQLFYYSPAGTISGLNENFWLLSEVGSLPSAYPVISGKHATAGATVKRSDLVYDVELYYKKNEGVIIDEIHNDGATKAYGLDAMIQKTSGIHKGWIAYSLSRVTQQHPLISGGREVPAWQDRRHEIKIVNMLSLGDWSLSSSIVYGSGKPFPKYDVIYIRDENNMILDYELLLDYSNRSRLPGYFRVDLAASYKFSSKGSAKGEIGLSVHNLTDHKNIKARSVNTTALEEAVFTNTEADEIYTDVVLLGLSPALFVSISF